MKRIAHTDVDISTFRRVGGARRGLVLLVAAAVLWLFMAAALHHHETDAEDRDCAICTAVVHHVVSLGAAPTVGLTLAALIYRIDLVTPPVLASIFKAVCPPICGPPIPGLTKPHTSNFR